MSDLLLVVVGVFIPTLAWFLECIFEPIPGLMPTKVHLLLVGLVPIANFWSLCNWPDHQRR
ncbi:MAG: hypothetical protein KC910_13990, partial [Candidatus Eremiobacteraeota bacterium]|nr:hypothetical protein [Candidatus Eremiobacteraeota bacterium]